MKKIILSLIICTYLSVFSFSFASLEPQDQEEVIEIKQVKQIDLFIRQNEDIIFSSRVDLPEDGTIELLDNNNSSHTINKRSVLGLLYQVDQVTDSFNISNLAYYDSFSSFYIKCITTTTKGESCDNWQYVLNGSNPLTSVDQTILSGDESLGLYFGNPFKLELDKTNINKNDSVLVKAFSYDYLSGSWNKRTSINIGITKPNEADPWNPIIVSTALVDQNGEIVLTLQESGSYNIGVSEDFYFPSYPIVVSDTTSGGGGGGGGGIIYSFYVNKATDFLLSNQLSDGSFGNLMYTDWTTIGSASNPNTPMSEKAKIAEYFKNNNFNSNILTENERHAMALMSLGINPYSGTNINYINKILETFDGNQLGDSSEINDDIFGLIVLKNVGYSTNDDVIKKSIDFILSKQGQDGSFGSVDMTAAAIISLRNFIEYANVSNSVSLSEQYLLNNQDIDGSFGNTFSTSWALQALSLNPNLSSNINKTHVYLAKNQKEDGGMEDISESKENRIWSTAYAIPAILGKSWNNIMSSFNKETIPNNVLNNTSPVNILKIEDKKVEIKNDELKDIIKLDDFKKVSKNKIRNNNSKKIIKDVKLLVDTKKENLLTANVLNSNDDIVKKSLFKTFFSTIFSPFLWLLEYI